MEMELNMSQSYDELLKEAEEKFDFFVKFNDKESVVINEALAMINYSDVMAALIETAMTVKLQFVKMYVVALTQHNKENGSLGPDSLIDPHKGE